MVMTDYMYHLMFEPIKENECMYLLNEIRPKRKTKRSMADRYATILKEKKLCAK